MFVVLAFAAPLTVVAGTLPLVFGLGNGAGAPGTFLIAAAVLACFAVGYVTMSQHVMNTGAFYAYIAQGLGRFTGSAAAIVALLVYCAGTTSTLVLLGIFAESVLNAKLSVNLDWWTWAAIALAIATALCYRRVTASARVLGTVLVLEMSLIVATGVGILLTEGPSAFTLSVFSAHSVFNSGSFAVAMLFAFLSYLGLEATVIFSEEARDPEKTVPRATYLAIAIIGVLYIFASWMLIAFYGSDAIVETAMENPIGMLFVATEATLGGFITNVMEYLVVASVFAVLLAIYNSAARYVFSVSRAGLLPKVLSGTHPKFKSPTGGVGAVLVFTVVVVTPFAVSGIEPYADYFAPVAGFITVGIVALEAVVSIAVVVFFRRRHDPRIGRTVIAPSIAAACLGAMTVLILDNYSLQTGEGGGLLQELPWLLLIGAGVGLLLAQWLRTSNPSRYASLGHEREVEIFEEPVGVAPDPPETTGVR